MRATDLVGSRLTPPGFYYKTFIRPRRLWPLYEKVLRHAAGLGKLPKKQAEREWRTEYRRRHADVLVIGGGIAGMAAALRAAELGADVVLVDDGPELGGSAARRRSGRRGRGAGREGARRRDRGARAGGRDRLVRRARAGLVRQHAASDPGRRPHHRDRLDRAAADVRGQRPARGDAVLRRRAARRALRGAAREDARWSRPPPIAGSSPRSPCATPGVAVAGVADARPAGADEELAARLEREGIPLLRGTVVVRAFGRKQVKGAVVATLGERRPARRRDRARHRLRPGRRLRRQRPVGLAAPPGRRQGAVGRGRRRLRAGRDPAGHLRGGGRRRSRLAGRRRGLGRAGRRRGRALARARGRRRPRAGLAETRESPRTRRSSASGRSRRRRRGAGRGHGKCFACLCEDVTTDDIDFSIDEGFDSLELLKRYTTVTMGPCQGRMCQLASIRKMAEHTGRAPVEEVGLTTAQAAVVERADGSAGRPAVRAGEALGGPRAPSRARRRRALGGRLAAPLRLRRSRRARPWPCTTAPA